MTFRLTGYRLRETEELCLFVLMEVHVLSMCCEVTHCMLPLQCYFLMFVLLQQLHVNVVTVCWSTTALQRLTGFGKNQNMKQQLANNISARREKKISTENTCE